VRYKNAGTLTCGRHDLKIAVISDIHSNLEALTTALELIRSGGIETTVCLGDIVGYGANPNECVDLVREHCAVVVRGNHDAGVVDTRITDNFSRNARAAIFWTQSQLSAANLDFLASLPLTASLYGLLLVHASPHEPDRWHYIVDAWEARQAMHAFSGSGCFVGHSHVPGIFSARGRETNVKQGERFLINVGSIGQPRDRNPLLSFGVFDTDAWSYENVRAEYDIDLAARKILGKGLPATLAQRLALGV